MGLRDNVVELRLLIVLKNVPKLNGTYSYDKSKLSPSSPFLKHSQRRWSFAELLLRKTIGATKH